MKLDPRIDALFQLPLDQFTQKRNALAKELSGESKTQVKFLTKPPLPIWAVNQLYWQDRPTYSALIDASEKLRAAHRAALSGRKADIRPAEKVHHAVLEKAIAQTLALLKASEGQVSDAARDSIRKTLAALPTEEDAGRLTRAPEAAGFSLLTGILGATGAAGAAGARGAAGLPAEARSNAGAKAGARGAAGLPAEARSNAGAKAGARGAAGLPAEARSNAGAKAGAEAAALKKAKEAEKAEAAARKRAEAAMAAKAAARERAITAAERALQQTRKAAEQAKFKVRKFTVELERAQAQEERLGRDVSAAEQKLSRLRMAD